MGLETIELISAIATETNWDSCLVVDPVVSLESGILTELEMVSDITQTLSFVSCLQLEET